MGTPDKVDIVHDPHEDRQALTLATTVERLRAEIDGLQRSLRARTVVEQAKGLLGERLNCGVDTAYDYLLQLAAQAGVKPATAAALLLGQALPTPADIDDKTAPDFTLFDPAAYLSEAVPRTRRGGSDQPAKPHLPAGNHAGRHLAAAALSS